MSAIPLTATEITDIASQPRKQTEGQSIPALPGTVLDVDLLGYGEDIVHLDAEVS